MLNQILGLTAVPECAETTPEGVPLHRRNRNAEWRNSDLSIVPTKSGVQRYQCLIHPWMQTTVTVKK